MSWSLSYSICSALCGLIIWGALDVPLSLQLLVKDIMLREVLIHVRLGKNNFSWILDILLLTMSGNLCFLRRDVHKDWLCDVLIHKHC